jgi:hypothetical protein
MRLYICICLLFVSIIPCTSPSTTQGVYPASGVTNLVRR